ncbi:MAG: ABC transporter permease [Gemmatimonadales bacterium]
MNKIIAVIRREYTERVRTRAFILSTILLPVLIVFTSVVPALMMSSGDRTSRVALVDGTTNGVGEQALAALTTQKLSDKPGALPRFQLTRFDAVGRVAAVQDSLVAQTGFDKGSKADSWDGVIVVTDDAITSGKLNYYGNNVGSFESMGRIQSVFSRVFATSRLSKSGVDPALVMGAMTPADLQTTKVTDGKATGQSGQTSFFIAYIMGFILYLGIILYGQQTMTSVIEEKTSRIMEVLASSLTPFQMLLGKVVGVGLVGLTQMTIWGGSVFLVGSNRDKLASVFHVSADAIQSFPIPTMAPDLLAVFLVYFALGFLLYGALYAAIGSMVNTVQEAQQTAVFVTVVIMIGFFSVFALIKDPAGSLGVTMSFIPFFAPFVMPVRWSLASVPTSQLVLSLALMVIGLLACVWLAGRIYRTGILMYGKKPTFKELFHWIRVG